MEFTEILQNRRSIRKFKPDPVPDSAVDELLEAARLAPSASNLQPWRFVVVKSDEMKEKLAAVTPYKFAVRAPVVFVCGVDLSVGEQKKERVRELLEMGAFTDVEIERPDPKKYPNSPGDMLTAEGYLAINTGIAVEHIVLRAADLGLGTCWVGRFDTKKAREILELDANIQLVALLPLGYPAQSPAPRPRFKKSDILLKTI